MRITLKTVLITLVVFSALFVVISQAWQTVKQLELTSRQLVNEDLILYEKIQTVRNLLNDQQLKFYQYYLNGIDPDFQTNYQTSKTQLKNTLQPLEAAFFESEALQSIHENIEQLESVVAAFTLAMQQPTDWDRARQILADFEPVAQQLDQLSLKLTHQLNQQLMLNAQTSLEETESGVFWISAMGLMLFVSAAGLLILNKHLLTALVQKRRLASYPEFNPSPVLAVSDTSQVTYANPGAVRLSQSLFGKASPEKILPDSLNKFLNSKGGRKPKFQMEYRLKEEVYDINAHWVGELNEYHVYLTNITQQHHAHEKLRFMAFHHSISNLPNRQSLVSEFASKRPEHLMLIEINRFTEIITSSGHERADDVIKLTAKRLAGALKSSRAKLFHLESNLFAVSLISAMEPAILAEKIFNIFGKPVAIADRHFYLTFTIGGVKVEVNSDLFEVMRKADSALHSIPNQFGNNFIAYDDVLDKFLLRRMTLENDLRHAIKQQELEVYYQPIIDAKSGQPTSAEALMRWHYRRSEWVSPAEFIPIAESSGLIIDLGKWLIDEVFCNFAVMAESGKQPITLAINISAIQWQDESLVPFLKAKLRHYQLAAKSFTLEITEQVALQDIDRTITMLQALKTIGFKIAIDDFGTGYSSLNYLHGLPVDAIKIDKSFVSTLSLNNKNSTIVEMLISLAHQLNLKVVAEGVETDAQNQQLFGWHCDFIQGFLFSKPLDKAAYAAYLSQYD
ncbi:MAG: bifunctional diguanylate cyclase/phosphodiesterase [Gammaproteobacteria bacterium]|nr:bifunctional diguanylate cyclase/phosphodiesterase [Gammaproteobacteria bacterium]